MRTYFFVFVVSSFFLFFYFLIFKKFLLENKAFKQRGNMCWDKKNEPGMNTSYHIDSLRESFFLFILRVLSIVCSIRFSLILFSIYVCMRVFVLLFLTLPWASGQSFRASPYLLIYIKLGQISMPKKLLNKTGLCWYWCWDLGILSVALCTSQLAS